MSDIKFITIETSKLDEIIKKAINHIANEMSLGLYMEIISSVKKQLIKNNIPRDVSKFSDDSELNQILKNSLQISAKVNELYLSMICIDDDKQGWDKTQKVQRRQVGVDDEGTPLYAGDIVIDGDGIERTIEWDRHREKFDCGYIEGYWIPDICVKKVDAFPLYKQEKEMDECLQPDIRQIYLKNTVGVGVLNKRPPNTGTLE